jgi:hypothetical protein
MSLRIIKPTQTSINHKKRTFCIISLLEHMETKITGHIYYLGIELFLHASKVKSTLWDSFFMGLQKL